VRVAIASGKGGAGKTTFATNLAVTAAVAGVDVVLLDCDVEEPDCRLFLWPGLEQEEPVTVAVPEVDEALCNHCGVCARVCEFKAITVLPSSVLAFPELCHACGACVLLCPRDAIREVERRIGALQRGHAGGITFAQGTLDVGEARAVPLIKAVRTVGGEPRSGGRSASLEAATLVIIDSPPGTSCPTIEACRGADLVVLVTEPTRFGLNDLRLAADMVRVLGLPFVVAVNRSDIGDDRVRRFCEDERIAVIAELPDDRRIAEAYSRGRLAVATVPGVRESFNGIWNAISGRLGDPRPDVVAASVPSAGKPR
jgi:MinD superfamily P-loop ATPase